MSFAVRDEYLSRWIMTAFLRSHALVLCLGLALVICCLFGSYLVSNETMPFGDGQHYASRAFALYGYLHTGQGGKFWELLTSPKQSLAPLHYWLFFLVPQAWAGLAAYAALQLATTYFLLAVAVWKLCRVLERPEWAPAIFLLCAVQNYSLDYSYSFLLDMPFFALATLILAWQIEAWREPALRRSALTGIGVGFLFWIKPANAIFFLAPFLITEISRMVLNLRAARRGEDLRRVLLSLMRHLVGILIGFVPVTVAALACGAGQSIIRLIDFNEVSTALTTKLACTGFERIFYFPLCLVYFYHAVVLVTLFGAGIGIMHLREKPDGRTVPPVFPWQWLVPVLIAYLILGEFFSFVMYAKTMRSLLIILPMLWIVLFRGLEKWHVRVGTIFVASLLYVTIAFSQIFYETLGTFSLTPDEDQLTGDYFGRMPYTWSSSRAGVPLNREICNSIKKSLPQGGKIGINTTRVFFSDKCLYWGLEHEALLRGEPEIYQMATLFNDEGKYYRSGLINANMLVMLSHPNTQTTEATWRASMKLFNYGREQWRTREPLAKIMLLPLSVDAPLGYDVIFEKPLSEARITEAMTAISCPEADEIEKHPETSEVYGHHYSREEAAQILRDWKARRFGG